MVCKEPHPPVPPVPQFPVGVNPPPFPGPEPCGPGPVTPPLPHMPHIPPVPPIGRKPICPLPCGITEYKRVLIPSTMGNHKSLPATELEYRNVILQYEYDSYVYIYSSDGIPVLISDELKSNFNDLFNRPLYDGEPMDSLTDIPRVPLKLDDLSDGERVTVLEQTTSDITENIEKINQTDKEIIENNIQQDNRLAELEKDTADLKTNKQDTLISGRNIKTVNNVSLLGPGNIEVSAEGLNLQEKLVSGENIKTINNESLLGSGDIPVVTTVYEAYGENTNGSLSQRFTSEKLQNLENRSVVGNIRVGDDNTSTTTLHVTKMTLGTGNENVAEIPLPVASEVQAGVVNPATYQTIQSTAEAVESIQGGSVAITGIAASPEQDALTAAWKEASGKETLINGASIFDIDNDKVYTYYTNTNTWYGVDAAKPELTIDNFTNTEAGLIKGDAETDGKIQAEPDGTASVKGWDTMKSDIANLHDIIGNIDDELIRINTGEGV